MATSPAQAVNTTRVDGFVVANSNDYHGDGIPRDKALDDSIPGDSASSTSRSSESQGDELGAEDMKCGYYNCQPDCLQKCAKPPYLLAAMCALSFIDAFIAWGIINVNLSTIERRFQLSSTQSSWILVAGDIAGGILNPVFSYLATFYHKGRMIFGGAICMVIGNLMFTVPHLASGTYELSGAYSEETCDLSTNSSLLTACDELIDTDMSRWLPMFCFAQVFFSYTGTTLWMIGIAWIDENVKYESSSLYIGIYNTLSALGACAGFLLGGVFLQIYVDVGRVDMDDVDIEPSDPRWVGAWWMGFAVAAGFSLITLFFISCFPRQLPDAVKYRRLRKSEAHKGKGEDDTADSASWRHVGRSLKVIFTNPVFVLITIAGIVEVGGIGAYAAYLPKILQFQFSMTTSAAAIVAGAVIVPAAAIGQMLGGIIPRVAHLRFRGTMWMLIICQFTCVLCTLGFLFTCPTPVIAGYNADYYLNTSMEYSDPFEQPCNTACNCSTLEFIPICSSEEEDVAYFSPCYAGCLSTTEADGVTTYSNCSCLPDGESYQSAQAEEGLCTGTCGNFWIFMPLMIVFVVATFIENTGGYAVVLRCVPDKQRAFAFGLQGPIIKYLGTVPIPIIFGVIFDSACEVWQDNCGSQGSCWIYDSKFLSIGMFVAGLIIKGVSGTCFLIAVCVYKPPPISDQKTTDVTDSDTTQEHTKDSNPEKVVPAIDSLKSGGVIQNGKATSQITGYENKLVNPNNPDITYLESSYL